MVYVLHAKKMANQLISICLFLTHQLPLFSGIGFIVRILLGLYFQRFSK